jgi:hypothetical protein
MLGFIKQNSKELNDKMLDVALVRPGAQYASCVWSPHQEVHSARIERIQHNFISFALRDLGWTTQLSPSLFMRGGGLS